MRNLSSLVSMRHADPGSDLEDVFRWIGPRSDLRGTSINGEVALSIETAKLIIENPDGHSLIASTNAGESFGLVWLIPYGPPSSRTYEIECIVGIAELRGTAHAGAMIIEALEFAFLDLDALKILITFPAHNRQATRLVAKHKVGVLECVMRDFYFIENRYIEGWIWGLFKDEYMEARGKWNSVK